MNIVDINSRSENIIERRLSNLALHQFEFRGLSQISAESVIQGVKYKEPYEQMYALRLSGIRALREGSKINWKREQKLYWFGQEMGRESVEYQKFLDDLYISLLQNEQFKTYLIQSAGCQLIHTIGNNNPQDTVLTEAELCNRLMSIREFILTNKTYSRQDLKDYLSLFHNKYLS